MEIDDFFNKNGKLYKEQDIKDKLPTLDYSSKLGLLLSDGKMIKRPIIDYNDEILLGFNKQTIARIETLNHKWGCNEIKNSPSIK
jgi:arsenate reductase